MSILIKGREMPNNCQECVCLNDEYFYCQAVGRQPQDENVVSRRPDWCPLVEVPTPHGRLIDADALLKLLDSCMFPSDMVTTRALSMATNWLKEAPTIIEAEEES